MTATAAVAAGMHGSLHQRSYNSGVRAAAVVLVSVLVLGGCSTGDEQASTPIGCEMVPRARVVGLLGDRVRSSVSGSVTSLRTKHRALGCRGTVPGHPERYVNVTASYHPRPVALPATGCTEGWVYAGTADKFSPACQDTVDGHGRTRLLVRWQPYLMRVTIGRSDRNWGGDPEVGLAMSRVLAQRLEVREAAGDG